MYNEVYNFLLKNLVYPLEKAMTKITEYSPFSGTSPHQKTVLCSQQYEVLRHNTSCTTLAQENCSFIENSHISHRSRQILMYLHQSKS